MDSNFSKQRLIALLVMGLAFAVGCDLTVTVKVPDFIPTYVVNSLFTPDSVWTVKLSQSKSALDDKPYPVIDDAVVRILDDNQSEIEVLIPQGKGVYKGASKPVVGPVYYLEVIHQGHILKSHGSIPARVPITSIEANGGEMNLRFKDPEAIANYYLVKVVKESQFTTGNVTYYTRTEDFMGPNDPSLEYGYFGKSIYLNDRLFDGKLFEFRAQMANPPNTKVYLFTVSESYFNYFMETGRQEQASGDAFAQPTQVSSNIENGWGVFAGYNFEVGNIQKL
jgi:hypothetical protein